MYTAETVFAILRDFFICLGILSYMILGPSQPREKPPSPPQKDQQ